MTSLMIWSGDMNKMSMYAPKELLKSNSGKSISEVGDLIAEEDVRSKLFDFVKGIHISLNDHDIKVTEIKVSTHARFRGKPFYSVRLDIPTLKTAFFFQNSTKGSGYSDEIVISLWVGGKKIKNLKGAYAKQLGQQTAKLIANSISTTRVASQHMSKTAASGNYGFTKSVQSDVEVALRKLEKKVNALARFVEKKHPEVGTYFGTRCQGSNCNASKALSNKCLLNQHPKRLSNGPLGFKPACAKSAHKAITDLILYSGEVAHSLHQKSNNHIPYLQTHSKKKRCPLTRLLLENYPVETL